MFHINELYTLNDSNKTGSSRMAYGNWSTEDDESAAGSRQKNQVQLFNLMKRRSTDHIEWHLYDYWIFTLAISHIVMLIVLTTFISIMFLNLKDSHKIQRNNVQLISSNWIITPGNCKMWIDGSCARSDDIALDPRSLEGVLHETEKSSTGLFSSINAPFLTLSAMVLSTAFSFSMLRIRDESITPKMFRAFSLLILIVYGVLFLFIQQDWRLPMNNLFLVEALFMLAFLLINTFSVENKHMYFGFRILNIVFTYPLIAVSIFSIIGEDNSNNLLIIYFSLVVSFSIILLVNNENVTSNIISASIWPTFWIALLPFIIFCGIRFEYMTYESPIEYPTWSIIALILLFIFYVIDAIAWSVQYFTDSVYIKMFSIDFSIPSMLLKTIGLIEKYVLILLVVIGFYNEFK